MKSIAQMAEDLLDIISFLESRLKVIKEGYPKEMAFDDLAAIIKKKSEDAQSPSL